jgi:prepilin-type N-terminal cleavage/methylation domain-containing protein
MNARASCRVDWRVLMSWSIGHRQKTPSAGFTLVEIVITVAILTLLSVIAIPTIQSVLSYYRLRSAVTYLTGTIQSTRYQAISKGYAYMIVLDKATETLQVQSDPTRTSAFANVGNAVPLAGSGIPVVLGQDTALMLRPSGIIQPVAGSMTMTLTLSGRTETITVASYGNIKVTP